MEEKGKYHRLDEYNGIWKHEGRTSEGRSGTVAGQEAVKAQDESSKCRLQDGRPIRISLQQ